MCEILIIINSFSTGHVSRELLSKNMQINSIYTLDLYHLDTGTCPLGEDR